jgi:hypothetical protein
VPATALSGFCQDFFGPFRDVGLTAVVFPDSRDGRPLVLTRVLAQNIGNKIFDTSTLGLRHRAELEGGIGIKIEGESHGNGIEEKKGMPREEFFG